MINAVIGAITISENIGKISDNVRNNKKLLELFQ